MQPRTVNIALGKDVQTDYESWVECCESLGVTQRINSFLFYIGEFGTYENPKTPEEQVKYMV